MSNYAPGLIQGSVVMGYKLASLAGSLLKARMAWENTTLEVQSFQLRGIWLQTETKL